MNQDKNYICQYCSKRYIRKHVYDHHVLMCGIANINGNNRKAQNIPDKAVLETIPSQKELYQIVIDLNNKYERLQRDYDLLKQYVDNKRKKIDIVEWLNDNSRIERGGLFSEVALNIELVDSDVRKVFELDYVKGVADIIVGFIKGLEGKTGACLRAFDQKDGVFYIYDKDLGSNDGLGDGDRDGLGDGLVDGEQNISKWQIMPIELFERFIRIIDHQLLRLFREWHRVTESGMNEDRFSELYIKNLKTVTGGNFRQAEKTGKIKTLVYRGIKENLKSMIVYDFG
jgi:hypothetical protein